MNCKNCGSKNKKGDRFCVICGYPLKIKEKSYYEILGVSRDASSEDIKRVYYILAHQYHPDKNNGNDKRFKEVVEAYRILSDQVRKKEYDKGLKFQDDAKEDFNETSNNEEPKNYTENNNAEKPHYKTIIFIIIAIVAVIYFLSNSPDESPVGETPSTVATVDEGTYLILGGEPIIKDDFSLNFVWYTAGEVLERKEVSVENDYSYKEPNTNGMFAIVIVSMKNNGKERRVISLSDFSFVDLEERIYKPYFMLNNANTYDEKGKIVPVVRAFDNINISIQPGIEEKRAIIFEIAKDIKTASLKFKYK